MHRSLFHAFFALLLTVLPATAALAQAPLRLSVTSFELTPLDTSCQTHQQHDSNGDLMAIVKVTSATTGDDLSAYHFDFANMRHDTEGLHDGELWLYVQRNARFVTISRQGYATVRRYELVPAVEAGKVYRMQLSSESPKVYTQMVLFQIEPPTARAMVSVRPDTPGAQWQPIGLAEEGAVAKNLALGRYLYQVLAENYYQADGTFSLTDASGNTHTERVVLRPNFAEVSLTVDADADIYVNNELKGRRSWRGPLSAGDYQVECRHEHHRPSSQRITVVEGKPLTVTLTPPTPITGTLSVISKPLGATITVDGRDYGTTPRNLTAMLIGRHTVALSKAGYETAQQTVEVREAETASLELTLKAAAVATTPTTPTVPATPTSGDLSFTVTGNGKTVTFKMIRIAPGTFQMGSNDGYESVMPVHSVTLTKAYYMGETEVTQALWQAVMGYKPTSGGSQWTSSYGLGDDYPAYYISYTDCQEFITKLNSMTGKTFRMPTEAEWEFAARGGTKSKGYTYAGSNTIGDVAWYSSSKTHAVGGKQPNELGLYDMSGNVWEWCADWYGSYTSDSQTNPTGPATGSYLVYRGGCWRGNATGCRTAQRLCDSPGNRYPNLGFRLAL